MLAVLERRSGNDGELFPESEFGARVIGGHSRFLGWLRWLSRLKPARTESHKFASRPALVGIALLAVAVAAVLVEANLTLFWPAEPAPLDCVGGLARLVP
ncbi:hypothetical protein [Streptomyces spinosirectus]